MIDRWMLVVGMVALFSIAPLAPGVAATEEPGQGFAFGQGWKVDPKAGGLSIGIAFGQSTAIHTNQVGRAVSTSTNFGVIGLTVGSTNCDGSAATWPLDQQPQPLIVDSRDKGAAAGTTATDWHERAFTKSGMATAAPFAKATTTIFSGGGGQSGSSFEMGSAVVTSSSGVVNGVREARATVELDYLNAAGGPGSVRMKGLRWDALHRSTGETKSEGHFTIGSIAFNNGPPTTGLADDRATAALQQANPILRSLGLKLVPGSIRTSKDAATVDPLAIVVEPNATRDGVTQNVLGNPVYKTVRQAITDAILKSGAPNDDPSTPQDERRTGCRAGTYISVADIVVGSVTGAGEFILSFGGVEATTGETPKNSFNLDLGDFGTTPDLDIPGEPALESSFLGAPDIVDGPAVPFVPGGTPPTPGTPSTRLVNPAASSRGPGPDPFEGNRGGALAVVGLVTLGVLAMVAEGDRRKMRAARLLQAQQAGPEAGA